MNSSDKSTNYLILDTIGRFLYGVWVVVFLLWAAMYSYSVDGQALHVRGGQDVLMWLVALLSIAGLASSIWMSKKGVKMLGILAIVLWAVLTPLALVSWGTGENFMSLVGDPMYFLNSLADVVSPIFIVPYFLGLASYILIGRLYKKGYVLHDKK